MCTHAHRPPRRALPLLLLAALLALGGTANWIGSPHSAAAVTRGKNGLIAASRMVGNERHIFTMTAKGKLGQELTAGPVDDKPRWSPDGAWLLFTRSGDLWKVPVGGGAPTNLTRSAAFEHGAAWSPDGSRIAYLRDVDIWTMQADGLAPRFLLRLGDGVTVADFSIDWSPDGRRLVFGACSSGVCGAWVADADGRNPTPLASISWEPRWSPDGQRIAFTRGGDVWVMKADGSNQRNLTNSPAVSEQFPTWSPDGKRILFRARDSNYICLGATSGR